MIAFCDVRMFMLGKWKFISISITIPVCDHFSGGMKFLKHFVLRILNFIQKYSLISKVFDGFMLIFCLLYLDLHGARCLTAGTCAARYNLMSCAPPSKFCIQTNTLLQVIICPLVLYWQRFLFRDFSKFKVLKILLKIQKITKRKEEMSLENISRH